MALPTLEISVVTPVLFADGDERAIGVKTATGKSWRVSVSLLIERAYYAPVEIAGKQKKHFLKTTDKNVEKREIADLKRWLGA